MVNAADGAGRGGGAFGARVETTLRESGPWERVHPVGYVDAMAATEMSLATGLTEGLAGRKAALGAALGERFPMIRDLVLAATVASANAQKVVDACAGLDVRGVPAGGCRARGTAGVDGPGARHVGGAEGGLPGGCGPGRRPRGPDPSRVAAWRSGRASTG